MAPYFDAELVVAYRAEGIVVANGDKVVELIKTPVVRNRLNSFLGDDVIQLELAHLHVEPRTLKKVVKASPGRLKVKSTGVVGRRHQEERNIVVERATGKNVEPR